MAVLNSWQKLTRVLQGKPFGDGVDGDYNNATIPTLVYRSCSGTAESTTLTLGATGFSDGDVVLIHQTRGTGVGQWEVNRIASGGGTTSLTLTKPLQYTYTDSGASQAQVVKVFRYKNVTVATGTWDTTAWNQDTGGLFTMAVKGSLTLTGTLTVAGNAGGTSTGGSWIASGGAGRGFRGANGIGDSGTPNWGGQGEGTAGDRTSEGGTQRTTANGNGGGGGGTTNSGDSRAGGGGGGHAASGGNGSLASEGGNVAGSGGGTAGSADLTTLVFGGGGGGGGHNPVGNVAAGGGGGGAAIIYARSINEPTGGISANGGNGGNVGADGSNGGAGAGGSVLLVCKNAVLGTNKITASAGTNTSLGGSGSVGRVAVHHSGTVTGTTTPTFTDVEDKTLVERQPGAGLLMLT